MFSEGVGHFERKFSVDGDVARSPSMHRYIWEWCSYNFAGGSFDAKKLCSRLLSIEVEFYWQNIKIAFCATFGGLTGNVHGSSMVVGKRMVNFILVLIELFSPAITVEDIGKRILVEIVVFKNGVDHMSANFRGNRRSLTNDWWRQKNKVAGLSCGVVCVILRLAVLTQYRRMTDRPTHWHTDTRRRLRG